MQTMRPSVRLVLLAGLIGISVAYTALLVREPEIASALSSGYVALLLTVLALVHFWKKPANAPLPADRRRPTRLTVKLAELVVIGMTVQLGVIAYVFITDFHGRQDTVKAAREGCERDKLDRTASAILNDALLASFDASQKKVPKIVSKERLEAVKKIRETNEGLKVRARINCDKRYPEASLLP